MERNLITILRDTASRLPDKIAFEDAHHALSFRALVDGSDRIATAIGNAFPEKFEPVAIYLDKSVESMLAVYGIIASGNIYCMVDTEMPKDRVEKIMEKMQPSLVLTDKEHKETVASFAGSAPILLLEDALAVTPDEERLASIRAEMIDTDPLYILFTSGSTGTPKGVITCQGNIRNYMAFVGEELHIDEHDILGNQVPFYFDMSGHDIYCPAFYGATVQIIPSHLFGFPLKLIEFLNEKKITSIKWVPSAMGIVSTLKAFRAAVPQYLRLIIFAGEVLPRKVLDYWRQYLPDAVYANFYGPTETTFACMAHIYTGTEPADKPLPIGKPFRGTQVLLLDDEGCPVADGETGEICIRGTNVSLGYYNDPEKTAAAFVQNPLVHGYVDTIYKTGDLGYMDRDGNIVYVSRKDDQIKLMGYRIELGEIEAAASTMDGVSECACVYNDKYKRIVLCYDGTPQEEADYLSYIGGKVPHYMVPGMLVHLDAMPHNANGKIDRKTLQKEYGGQDK